LDRLITKKKTEYGLEKDYHISKETIQTRMKRKNPEPAYLKSSLAAAEETLVELCIQMGNARQPLKPSEGLQLMNSLIQDRQLQRELIAFKKARRGMGQGNKFPERLGEVGKGYWKGFMRRHGHWLVTKRGESFASSRND
jgi:hypothetical protein